MAPLTAPSRTRSWVGAAVLATCVVACVPALPEAGTSRALVRDLVRIVDVRSRVGWLIDESELVTVLPDALRSACQVPDDGRAAARAWLDGAIAAGGGDVATAWRARGRDLDEVADLILYSRARLVLERSDEWIRAGRCPFWLESSLKFGGVHTQAGRFFLTLEGGGRFVQEFAFGSVKYGGGGSGRLLGGYGVSDAWSVSLGFEMGGSARFTNLALGEQSDLPEIVGFAVMPFVARWQFGLVAFTEVEVGPMAYFDEGSADPTTGEVSANFDQGLHAGFAIGGSYLRLQRGYMPRFAISFTVDYVPAKGGRPTLTQFGIGARTGIDIARWTRF